MNRNTEIKRKIAKQRRKERWENFVLLCKVLFLTLIGKYPKGSI
jgi:hypothetical protein